MRLQLAVEKVISLWEWGVEYYEERLRAMKQHTQRQLLR
ncbi:hypothetical protein PAUR_a1720 [Pseudoalteromonas aurantia 208]|uniref:Uncharacterized protein n=1 Tax=Pseudoalteromonas aurantia 208 TaxID=1314867 RepID=A0ABR9EB22_9GAMM|nr:hypothetical protein [Pseudoalteromonas aurantia 208]